jgi:hypothetical protein
MIFTIITKYLAGYYSLRQKFKKSKISLMKKIYSTINKGFQHETNSFLPFNNEIKDPINFVHGTMVYLFLVMQL